MLAESIMKQKKKKLHCEFFSNFICSNFIAAIIGKPAYDVIGLA